MILVRIDKKKDVCGVSIGKGLIEDLTNEIISWCKEWKLQKLGLKGVRVGYKPSSVLEQSHLCSSNGHSSGALIAQCL